MINRRQWLYGMGLVAGSGMQVGRAASVPAENAPQPVPLELSQYEPRSMLHVQESGVERSRFPLIDFHTHISGSTKSENGVELSPDREYLGTPQELLAVMDGKNIRAMVNLTGGYDRGLAEAVVKYDRTYPGRFYTFTEPSYSRFKEPDYPTLQAQAIERAHRDGGRGLKILKTLGLYLRENITSGSLVKIDDARFDPMWDACRQFSLPVAIHISDPIAFFTPTDRFNERYEELNNHPDWSFHGGDFPSNDELIAARNRVIARHPKTQFVVVHVGNFAEDLQNVSENLDRYPNMFVDLAARTSALGYRGCPFVNIAVEFPDRSHIARRMVADNKARLLKRLRELARAAGAHDASFLAKALALLIEGAYAASQTYGPGSALMTALPKAAESLVKAQMESPSGL